ncbi:MAG TPA: 16S rRNA (guanine(966)-N(2))-methyltransferase RsmD [Bacilli bacterium]|nr:16S rRNA (guanine(966)-N(2))-methyltransferase RsmD [Bacilli bacterium]
MRIISGIYSSRKLFGYDIDGIRPTMDKVKESLFAMINYKLNNSICLDLFAGTGSLGIEAISNGASYVYFVDNNINSIKTLRKNIENIDICDKVNIVNSDYKEAIKKYPLLIFDIIFVDPPYGVIKIEDVIKEILNKNILKKDGLIICEYENEELKDSYGNLNKFKHKRYGKTYITIYRN